MKIVISIAWGVAWFVAALVESILIGATSYSDMNSFGKIATIMTCVPVAYWVILAIIGTAQNIFKK